MINNKKKGGWNYDKRSIKSSPPPEKTGGRIVSNKTLYFSEKICYTSDVMHHNIKKRFFAFTLAEVLITLGIIGVVAAMTMPSLIAEHKTKETVAKLKKFNSVMNQALIMAIQEHGEISDWGLKISATPDGSSDADVSNSREGIDILAEKLGSKLQVVKKCEAGVACMGTTKRSSLDGTPNKNWTPIMQLADGSTINAFWITSPECNKNFGNTKALQNSCGEVFYDVNGSKPPNATGKDVFWFVLTKYGLVPGGLAEATGNSTFDNRCNLEKTGTGNGYGCTAWVIYNENMDYLKCNDLSWNGKTKCR